MYANPPRLSLFDGAFQGRLVEITCKVREVLQGSLSRVSSFTLSVSTSLTLALAHVTPHPREIRFWFIAAGD